MTDSQLHVGMSECDGSQENFTCPSSCAQSVDVSCSPDGPVGTKHPVQGLLERFEAGPGCAARELGNKETHVVALGRVTNSPERKVTVLLKPLPLSSSPLRPVHLVLSSKRPLTWLLEAEQLPSNLSVLVQVSANSSVQSHSLHLHVQTVHSVPLRPLALHRWALKYHGNLSSLTHATHGNRVYIRLGEDSTLPAVCRLQSLFVSHNYMTSDLQPQEVRGCTYAPADGDGPEVHVIKLHSAGSGLCGFLQVEVIVSLVPPVASLKTQKVVLILSSSVRVNWAIVARGVRGQISVHSSNSISPPFPPEPGLTLSSALNSDLSTISDLLAWARECGYRKVTSYTEADLANRFVIQLAEGGTDEVAVGNFLQMRPPWAEERELRQWLVTGGRAAGGRGSFTVSCDDGRLGVTVDQRILQRLSFAVAAVTLRDTTCQAQSNGSHFLLVFPVISCGTEGLLLGEPRGVQYKNMVLLWKDKPQTTVALTGTEKSKRPLSIHFSCLATISSRPILPSPTAVNKVNHPLELVPQGPESSPGLGHLPTPRHRSGPALILEIFVTENYEQMQNRPCVITAEQRVYVQISAQAPLTDVIQVKSCIVSPLSDPKKSPFWTVINNGCSFDPALILGTKTEGEKEDETDGDGELGEGKSGVDGPERGIHLHKERGGAGIDKSTRRKGEMEEAKHLRFSFILKPVYNNSMQFLHCSLHLCVSDSTRRETSKEEVKTDCQGGKRIPPLVSRSPRHQCEIRNLSRPMVVTRPISSLAPKMRAPSGQRTKRLNVTPVTSPDLKHGNFLVQTGPVMGIVFAAFVMGVSLMGAIWCIYNHTGGRPVFLRESYLTDQTRGGHSVWNPPSPPDQSSSSV
ncbi:transforming growth factor beta receptor type 3 [Xenentodon cancila]